MDDTVAQALNRLSARTVAHLKVPGRHADGGGLYASVSKDGNARRWVFLYRCQGKRREMGLGSLDAVPLARAREIAAKCRIQLAEGHDPIEAKRALDDAKRKAQATLERANTFGQVADNLIASKSPGWRNAKHRAQWRMTLKVYAAPLRDKPVSQITTEDILSVLQPMWIEKPETASRTRGRIEAVLDAARARGLIDQDAANPARWRGHLDLLLPRRPRHEQKHHAALHWPELPRFMSELRQREAIAARALEWCILTAARIGEALGTRWCEIDLDKAIWECPADRMKSGRSHRVPLSQAALELLARMPKGQPADLIFPGSKAGKPLSNMVMKALYRRMGYQDITTHGFRSTFRDWAGETTNHPREICEAALAHAVGNSVERAYRRGDALEKRRKLMDAWAEFCEQR